MSYDISRRGFRQWRARAAAGSVLAQSLVFLTRPVCHQHLAKCLCSPAIEYQGEAIGEVPAWCSSIIKIWGAGLGLGQWPNERGEKCFW